MYWRNSDFQLAHFLETHTPDEKYRILKQQLRERQKALALARVAGMRDSIRREELNIAAASRNDNLARAAKLDLLQLEAENMEVQDCITACEHEIETLERLLAEVQPLRKFSHLPDEEAFQACQEEEWAAKLCARAEDMLESQGFIPWDHLRTMKSHPQWANRIQPTIAAKRKELYYGRSRVLDTDPGAPVLLSGGSQ